MVMHGRGEKETEREPADRRSKNYRNDSSPFPALLISIRPGGKLRMGLSYVPPQPVCPPAVLCYMQQRKLHRTKVQGPP